jgi:hypothetical protein
VEVVAFVPAHPAATLELAAAIAEHCSWVFSTSFILEVLKIDSEVYDGRLECVLVITNCVFADGICEMVVDFSGSRSRMALNQRSSPLQKFLSGRKWSNDSRLYSRFDPRELQLIDEVSASPQCVDVRKLFIGRTPSDLMDNIITFAVQWSNVTEALLITEDTLVAVRIAIDQCFDAVTRMIEEEWRNALICLVVMGRGR